MYKLVLDRMVGIYKLHKNVAIMCAGNLESDGAIVQPLSTALQSRLVHLELEVNTKEWIDWANTKGFDNRITSYIEFRPDMLYSFKPDHTDHTYASPRTWEFVNKLLKTVEEVNAEMLPVLAGTISEGVAREFLAFCRIHDSLPKMKNILAAPSTHTVPEEPAARYALTGAIADHIDKDNCESLMTYLKRMPAEFQVICLRNVVKRKRQLLAQPALADWISSVSDDLY